MTVTLTNDAFAAYDFVAVYHQEADGSYKLVQKDIPVVGDTISFPASSFSVYAVTPTTPVLYTFKFINTTTNPETEVQSQVIKAGDDLYEPSTITFPGSTTRFLGWYYEGDTTKTPLTFTNTTNGSVLNIDTIPTDYADGNKVIRLVPLTADYYYVTFYDDTGYHDTDHGSPSVINIFEVEIEQQGDTTFDLSTVTLTAKQSNNTFLGWTETKGDTTAITTSTVVLTENKTYYPVIITGTRVTFDRNPPSSGTVTYWPPVVVAAGATVRSALNDTQNGVYANNPVTAGFVFDGWYTEAACTNAYDIENTTVPGGTADFTLYAKWNNVSSVSYTVNFWRQKLTDDKNAADADKTYDFVSFETRTLDTPGADGK